MRLTKNQRAADRQAPDAGAPPESSQGDPRDNVEGPQVDTSAPLSPLQYAVTRRQGTEPPFRNEYWDEHGDGIYVDVISGEPLFSSLDKYDSGTGWPSFTQPLRPDAVTKHNDHTLGVTRTEVRGRRSDAHLGHVFDDGPRPTGQRYCMNSAALRFIPRERLEEEGYGDYLGLFTEKRSA